MTQGLDQPASQVSVYMPRLVAQLPDGWTVSEGLTFTSPSDTQVRVKVDRAPDGSSAEQLNAEQARATASMTESFKENSSVEAVSFGGLPAHARTFSFRSDNVDREGLITTAIVGSSAISAGSSWASTIDEVAAVQDLLNRVRLVERQIYDTGVDLDSNGPRSAEAHGEPTSHVHNAPDWTSLSAQWATPGTDFELHEHTRWAVEELAVIAVLRGMAGFPTVDPDLLESLPVEARDAVITSTIRSLTARSLLRPASDGFEPAGALAEVCVPGLSPALVLTVEMAGRDHHSAHWFGISEESAVRIDLAEGGIRSCRILGAEGLIEELFELAGVAGKVGSTPLGQGTTELTIDELLDGSSSVDHLVQVQSGWMERGVHVGGLVAFAVTSGSVRLAEAADSTDPDARRWILTESDSDALRRTLVDHLPSD